MKQIYIRSLVFFLVIAFGVSAILIGNYYKKNNYQVFLTVLIIAIVILIINVLIFVISYLYFVINMKNKRLDANQLSAQIEENKKLAKQDVYTYHNKIIGIMALYNKYYLFITILMILSYLSICFISEILVGIFMFLAGINAYLIIRNTINIDVDYTRNYRFNKKQYPLLWSIIKKTANLMGIKKKIYCAYVYNNSVFVRQIRNKVYITLGIYVLQLMNEEELEAIFIHEFAHVYNNDTVCSYKLDKQMKKWAQVYNKKANTFLFYYFAPLADKLIKEYDIYLVISSKIFELKAEELAKTVANGEAFINALAKIELFNYFLNSERYSTINVYENESFPKNYFNIIYNSFITHYQDNKDEWKRIITLKIPDGIDTHPTFKERMEIYDQHSFNVNFDKAFPELPIILNNANNDLKRVNSTNHGFNRNNFYLQPLERIKNYEKNQDEYNRTRLIEVADAYRVFGKLEEALAVYDKILANQKDSVEVLFLKGTLLLSMDNDQGIDYIYEAISLNDRFLADGIPLIRYYCSKRGLEEKLEEVKDFVDSKRDYVLNVKLKETINLNDRFVRTSLSDEDINEIVNYIRKDYRITSIKIVDKIIDESHRLTIIGILVEAYSFKKLEEICTRISDYIYNDRSESIVLLPLNNAINYIPKFKAVRGSNVFTKNSKKQISK